jgi:hypothetical protein
MLRLRSKYDHLKQLREIGQGMLAAGQLRTVVCNTERIGGFHEVNAKCVKCGRNIWCDPLFSNAFTKLCIACNPCIKEV